MAIQCVDIELLSDGVSYEVLRPARMQRKYQNPIGYLLPITSTYWVFQSHHKRMTFGSNELRAIARKLDKLNVGAPKWTHRSTKKKV